VTLVAFAVDGVLVPLRTSTVVLPTSVVVPLPTLTGAVIVPGPTTCAMATGTKTTGEAIDAARMVRMQQASGQPRVSMALVP